MDNQTIEYNSSVAGISLRFLCLLCMVYCTLSSNNAYATQTSEHNQASEYNQNASIQSTPQTRSEDFIDSVAKQGIAFLSDESLSKEEKLKKFEDLLDNSFDMKTIARFALGRYWRTASRDQFKDYYLAFKEMIIKTYSERFSDYQGQNLQITGSQPSGTRDTIVNSYLQDDSGTKIMLQWRVRNTDETYKIIDIMVEGVSMVITQRSDFSSIIQRGGGNIDILTQHIRERLNKAVAQNDITATEETAP